MADKYIVNVPDIPILSESGDPVKEQVTETKVVDLVYSQRRFVRELTNQNPDWRKSLDDVEAAFNIRMAFERDAHLVCTKLAGDDYKLLLERINKPSYQGADGNKKDGFVFAPVVLFNCYPFLHAIKTASDKEPTVDAIVDARGKAETKPEAKAETPQERPSA